MSMPIPPNMPPSVTDIFERLRHLYSVLRIRWKVYRQLFGTSPDRIDVMNEIASMAFWVWQETMMDDMDLALSRLTDPMEMGKGKKRFENLSLERLVEAVEQVEGATSAIAQELRTLLQQAEVQCTKSRERRNKIIAHHDLGANTTQETAHTRPSRQEIQEALKTVEQMVNKVEVYYGGDEKLYDHFITQFDGDTLIAALKELQRRREDDPMDGRRSRRRKEPNK